MMCLVVKIIFYVFVFLLITPSKSTPLLSSSSLPVFTPPPPPPPFGYVGLAFPSSKDPSYCKRHPGTSTCVIIAGDVPYEWFEQWADTRLHHRGADYESLKAMLGGRLKKILLDRYPHLREKILHFDVGTPLDVNYYLGKTRGESYGLKSDGAKAAAEISWLFPKMSGFPNGLYITGQDLTSDGFAPAVLSAIMTCSAIEGPRFWLKTVVPMLGGVKKTLILLFSRPML